MFPQFCPSRDGLLISQLTFGLPLPPVQEGWSGRVEREPALEVATNTVKYAIDKNVVQYVILPMDNNIFATTLKINGSWLTRQLYSKTLKVFEIGSFYSTTRLVCLTGTFEALTRTLRSLYYQKNRCPYDLKQDWPQSWLFPENLDTFCRFGPFHYLHTTGTCSVNSGAFCMSYSCQVSHPVSQEERRQPEELTDFCWYVTVQKTKHSSIAKLLILVSVLSLTSQPIWFVRKLKSLNSSVSAARFAYRLCWHHWMLFWRLVSHRTHQISRSAPSCALKDAVFHFDLS